MPVINNATVATGTGLSTAGNGGRKITKLSNGWYVAAYKTGTNTIVWSVSKDNKDSWTQLCSSTNTTVDFALESVGTRVYTLTTNTTATSSYYFVFDAATVTNVNQSFTGLLDTGQLAGSIQAPTIESNEAGTELHAAWSSKNSTYPNSFNIRYAKGTINGDGSVTWGAVEQVTTSNSTTINYRNPAISLNKNSIPVIVYDYQGGEVHTRYIYAVEKSTGSWAFKLVFDGGSCDQKNPSALFVPQSINGLANGRLWVAWHGKDATDSAKFNVRVSYSDDGGVTWATPTKLTTGNLYDRQNVSLAADKTGKVFALYEEHQWSPDLDVYMRTFSGGSWGAPVAVAEADPAAESNPSALVDYSLQMTTPPFVFMSGTDGIKFSGNFNVGASVSPASGALGNKETATLTAYTVTPEAGSTVTQIVEKVNGVTVNTFNNPASLSRTLTVPQATWDTLAYFATHTASIAVTDSNGAQTVTTYTFDKMLGNGASLLEAEKANRDAKNRVAQKKDVLAAQVGLSAGATFDAISAQLASGTVFKKFATGTVTSVAANGSSVINTLTFKPSIVVFKYNSSRYSGSTYGATAQVFGEMSPVEILQQPTGLTAKNFTSNGFALINNDGAYANNSISWTALG